MADTQDDVVSDALDRFEESVEGSEENRENYYDDVKFARMADQWPEKVRKQRIQEGRPALVVNKLPSFIRSVVNESRQNKPAINVQPVDNGADEDHAEVIGGLIRSIERNSNAEVSYDTGIDNAVTGGFGFWRVEIDYAHAETFDTAAFIRRVPNSLMVHWDTSSIEYDSSDWEYAFVSEMIKNDHFEERYPNAAKVSFDGDSRDTISEQWVLDDSTRIAEYFLRESAEFELVQLAMPNPQTGQMDLQAVRESDLADMAAAFFQAGNLSTSDKDSAVQAYFQIVGIEERRRRTVDYYRVVRRVISGVEVLEEDEWPGQTIPICPVWGDEIFIDGRRYFRSMIADAKDPQQMLNFWRSASTELVALAPKTPFIGPKGFIPKGDESKWDAANTRSFAYLEYEKSAGEAPQRQAFAGVPAGVLQEAASNVDDMKSIMGIFDSSLGAQSNETSGKAIMARERQGDVSNFHFIDNLSRAIRGCGQILVEIIPSVYSQQHSVRILGLDEATNIAKLTQESVPTIQGSKKPELYNISVGTYDVVVKTGPSYTTQREETRETLIDIMRQVPDAAPFIGDVLLDHMDFVGADKVSQRLKALLPAEVRQAEDAAEGADDPQIAALQQQLQAQQQEMEQAKQAVMAEIQKITAENEALKADHAADQEKISIEKIKTVQADKRKSEELALKDRELSLKEREMDMSEHERKQAPVPPTSQETWDYEQQVREDEQTHTAEQKALDRQTDLAKSIIAKTDVGEGIGDEATAEAMHQAAEMVSKPGVERRRSYEAQASEVLRDVLDAITADRVLVRDDQGNATGSRLKRREEMN